MAKQVSPSNPLRVRSLEKWKRVFQDELDMKEGEEFLVLKTSISGWWYAINKKQEDGLIPYMYLEILSSNYVDYTTITQHEFCHIEKTVLSWDMNNLCQYVFQNQKNSAKEQNILLHVLRSLYIQCQKQDLRYILLSRGGLDRLSILLKNTYDIAIRTFCLRCLILLAPTVEARRFPAQNNLTQSILSVMDEYIDMPSFVCICTDALSNVAFQNEKQRMYASQTNCVEKLLYAMKKHSSVFKVQLQASRSLSNMISDPKIQNQIDDKGMEILLNSLNNAFKDNNNNKSQNGAMFSGDKSQFAQQMLVALSYLTTNPRKAESFAKMGGWKCIRTINNSIGCWNEQVRSTIVGILNSMSQNPAVTKCFFNNNFEGIDMLYDFCLENDPKSLFFYQIFSIITFIICKEPNKQKLSLLMSRCFDVKNLAKLMHECLKQTDNQRLMDTVPTICAMSVSSKDDKIQSKVYNSMVPMHLVNLCGNPPNNQFLNYTFITVQELTANPNYVDKFIQNGSIEMITAGNWYRDQSGNTDDSTIQNGILALVNLCSKTNRKLIPKQEKAVQNVIQTLKETSNHPQKKILIQKLELALKKTQTNSGTKPKKQRNPRNKNKGFDNQNNQNNHNNQQNGPNYAQSTYSSNARPSYNPFPSQNNMNNNNNKNNNYQQKQYRSQRQQNRNNNINNNINNNFNDNNQQNQYGSQQNMNNNNNNNNNYVHNQQNQYGAQNNFNNNNNGNNNYNPQNQQKQQNQQNQYGIQNNLNNNWNKNGYKNKPLPQKVNYAQNQSQSRFNDNNLQNHPTEINGVPVRKIVPKSGNKKSKKQKR